MKEEKITVEYLDKLSPLQNPKLICGLPGSGYVGKLAVDYLIDKFQATQIMNIYSSSFPPQVSIQPDGTIDLVKNSLYYCNVDSDELILFTGDAQPVSAEGEYCLAKKILQICKEIGVSEIYTLAAYITGKFAKSPKVFGTGTSLSIVKQLSELGILKLDKGNITGMNGVIIGMAKKNSMNGMCLLGETSGYVIDAKASKVVLDSLCKILGITLDMSELEKRAKDTEDIINALQTQALSGGEDSSMQLKTPSDNKSLGYIS